MLVQVVHCHPVAESYSGELFKTIVATLEQRRHQVVATDLYREQFDPALSERERRAYFHDPYPDDAVSAYTAALRRAEGIIFNFPQWWFAPPALLKGYFDRVWAPGIAFAHDLAGGQIEPRLTNIKLFGVVTTYGSPWWITKLAGDPGRKILLRGLKPMCGSRVQSFYLAHYDMDRSTPATRQAFIERIRATILAV